LRRWEQEAEGTRASPKDAAPSAACIVAGARAAAAADAAGGGCGGMDGEEEEETARRLAGESSASVRSGWMYMEGSLGRRMQRAKTTTGTSFGYRPACLMGHPTPGPAKIEAHVVVYIFYYLPIAKVYN
jgi:hypothetical protein